MLGGFMCRCKILENNPVWLFCTAASESQQIISYFHEEGKVPPALHHKLNIFINSQSIFSALHNCGRTAVGWGLMTSLTCSPLEWVSCVWWPSIAGIFGEEAQKMFHHTWVLVQFHGANFAFYKCMHMSMKSTVQSTVCSVVSKQLFIYCMSWYPSARLWTRIFMVAFCCATSHRSFCKNVLRSRSVRLKYVNRTPHWSLEHEWHYFNEIDVFKKKESNRTLKALSCPGARRANGGAMTRWMEIKKSG